MLQISIILILMVGFDLGMLTVIKMIYGIQLKPK